MASHPAIQRIRSTLAENSFTSGTWKIPVDLCDLYYKPAAPNAAPLMNLNLAKASDNELAQLIATCEAAPFGRGGQTVMDESYRKALKLELSQFGMAFELASTGILNKIQQDLVEPTTSLRRYVRAERYKLNIYDKGAFFKAHKDTPRAENMFGSLVVVFPTAHEGGSLVLRERGLEWSFDAGQMSGNSSDAPEITWVAFYSDTEHEVLPVTSGARVTLTYNLYFESTSKLAALSVPNVKYLALKESMQQLICDPGFLPDGGRLCFKLSHQYTLKKKGDLGYGYVVPELVQYLKGSDAFIYGACKELGLEVKLKVLYNSEGGIYMHDTPLGHSDDVIDRQAELFEDMEVIRAPQEDYDGSDDDDDEREVMEVVWVSDKGKTNRIESTYITFGNEACIEYIYGEVCLTVDLRL